MQAETAMRYESNESAIERDSRGAASVPAHRSGSSRLHPGRDFRSFVVVLHRYLTLSVGLIIVALSVSGSLLVFKSELLTPRDAAASGFGRAAVERSLQSLAEEALKPHPDARLQRVVFPELEGAALEIVIGAGDGSTQTIYADRSGLISSAGRERAFAWLRELHDVLFLEPALGARKAHWVVGVAGLLTLLVSFSGIYLWWPKGAHARKSALRVNWRASWKRANWDLHRVGGVLSAAFIFVVSASGTFVAFAYVDVEPAVAPAPRSSSGPLLSVDRLAEGALALAPGAFIRELRWGAAEGAPVLAVLDEPRRRDAMQGMLRLWLDPRSGELLQIAEPRVRSEALVMLDGVMRSIHRGHILGTPGRLMVFLTGFAPLFLAVSGLLIWWCKHRSRRVAADRTQSARRARSEGDRFGSREADFQSSARTRT